MTDDNKPPNIRMKKIDPDTGEEIPSTAEEQAEALAYLREGIRLGKLQFTNEVRQQLLDLGITEEVLESWLAEKDS